MYEICSGITTRWPRMPSSDVIVDSLGTTIRHWPSGNALATNRYP